MTDEVLTQEEKEAIAEADGLSMDDLDQILGTESEEPEEVVEESRPEPEAPGEGEPTEEAPEESTEERLARLEKERDHAARQRDAIIAERNAERQRAEALEREKQAQVEAAAAAKSEEDEELSEFERLVRDNENNGEALRDIRNMLEERQKVQELSGQIRIAQEYQAQQEAAYVEEVPEYPQLMNQARSAGRSYLINQGLTAEQADLEIRGAEARIALAAQQQGVNTAQVLHQFIVSRGLVAAPSAQAETQGANQGEAASADPAPAKAPKRRSTSLNDLGGRTPPTGGNAATDVIGRMSGQELADLEQSDPEKFESLLLESMKE